MSDDSPYFYDATDDTDVCDELPKGSRAILTAGYILMAMSLLFMGITFLNCEYEFLAMNPMFEQMYFTAISGLILLFFSLYAFKNCLYIDGIFIGVYGLFSLSAGIMAVVGGLLSDMISTAEISFGTFAVLSLVMMIVFIICMTAFIRQRMIFRSIVSGALAIGLFVLSILSNALFTIDSDVSTYFYVICGLCWLIAGAVGLIFGTLNLMKIETPKDF